MFYSSVDNSSSFGKDENICRWICGCDELKNSLAERLEQLPVRKPKGRKALCRSKLRFPSLPPTQEGKRPPFLCQSRSQSICSPISTWPNWQKQVRSTKSFCHQQRSPPYCVQYIALGPGSINRWNLWWRKDPQLTSHKSDLSHWYIF